MPLNHTRMEIKERKHALGCHHPSTPDHLPVSNIISLIITFQTANLDWENEGMKYGIRAKGPALGPVRSFSAIMKIVRK